MPEAVIRTLRDETTATADRRSDEDTHTHDGKVAVWLDFHHAEMLYNLMDTNTLRIQLRPHHAAIKAALAAAIRLDK